MIINRRKFLAALPGTAAMSMIGSPRGAMPDFAGAVSTGRLANDPLRPQYHLLPSANWMNDPNGPIFWNGQYHMFYQYNPDGAYWGDMHWGHAVSPDMVHWRHLPVALSPTPGGPDAAGCFTGTAVVQDGRVTILYTGVREASLDEATIKDGTPPLCESQCFAVSEDSDLRFWRKAPAPVIPAPPPQLQVNGFRDPSPWRQGDWWYAVVASGLAGEGGAVLLYRSRDLRGWEYMHILSRRDRHGTAGPNVFDPWEVWECPEFFALGDWHVLIFSTAGRTYWQSGKLEEKTMIFHVQEAGILDYGSFYAAKTQLDKAGNRIAWGWIPETRPLAEYKAAGWAGIMSLPRVLSAGSNGRLRMCVATEVSQLRGARKSLNINADEQNIAHQIEALQIAGCCGEIRCVVRRQGESFKLSLCDHFADDSPWLTIGYNPQHPDQLLVEGRPLSLTLGQNENLEIAAHIDSSVIELQVNGEIAWTRRFYPSGNSPCDLRLQWSGKAALIESLDLWQYCPISTDRLTT